MKRYVEEQIQPRTWYADTMLFVHSQTTAKAIEFYNKKAKELEMNIVDLEKIIQGKSQNLKIIEDGMNLRLFPLSHAHDFQLMLSSTSSKGFERRSRHSSYRLMLRYIGECFTYWPQSHISSLQAYKEIEVNTECRHQLEMIAIGNMLHETEC